MCAGWPSHPATSAKGANYFSLKPVKPAAGKECESEKTRIAEAADLINGELIWLGTVWDFHRPHGQLGD